MFDGSRFIVTAHIDAMRKSLGSTVMQLWSRMDWGWSWFLMQKNVRGSSRAFMTRHINYLKHNFVFPSHSNSQKKNPSDNRKIIILTYLILDKVSSSLCQVVCIKATSLVDHPAPFHAILGRHFYVSKIIIRTQIVIECYNFRCLYVLLIF